MKYTSLLFTLIFSVLTRADCQDSQMVPANTIEPPFAGTVREKIYVHTDKNFYIAGEIVWFKLYDVEAVFHRPLSLSKVAYIELLDTANKRVIQAKSGISNGDGNGSLYLPVTLPSGNYKLRAYTNWMKNFGAAGFFEKSITIINIQKPSASGPVNRSGDAKYTIQFLPEGGSLINGIRSRVAFKGTDLQGRGIYFTGALIDNKDTVLRFKPEHAGIGSFYFTPEQNHTYTAFIQPEKGNAFTKSLPAADATGYVMNVLDNSDSTFVVTVATGNTAAQEIYLIAHQNETISAAKKSVAQNGKADFIIPRSSLPDGITALTVFDGNKQPVCGRLYFKKPGKKLQLTIAADQPVYNNRKKVIVAIHADNMGTGNDSASLSLAVYRLDSLQSLDETTIGDYLLLTSGLKGPVENPAYYLGNDSHAKSAADNLMLVNGWSRFEPKESADKKGQVLKFAPEYNGHIVTGSITNNKTGKPQPVIETFLSVPGTHTQFYPCLSDSGGQVKFEIKDFYGASRIIVQTNGQQDSGYTIQINDPFSNSFSAAPVPTFALPVAAPNTLLEHSISMQVQNIYAGNKLNRFSPLLTDSSAFYLYADKKYLLDDYTRFTTMEEVLREYVELVNVTKKQGRYHFPVYDFGTTKVLGDDPLVLVDGVPVFDLNRFIGYDPLKLKKLEVVNRRYFFGDAVFDGILNWQTYNGDLANFDLDPKAIILDYEGLQEQREFYAPVYETETQAGSHLPDFRNVLYWNPDIHLHGNNTKQYSFYTSDLAGNYVAVVQGITGGGLCGSGMITFTVEK